MGCNCGKGAAGSTIAARSRQAARERAGSPVGFDAESAVLIGGDDGSEPVRVRVIRPIGALTVGQAAWVKGSGVALEIAAGDLLDITQRNQRARVWTVNGFTYTNEQEAKRVAAALGTTAFEVA